MNSPSAFRPYSMLTLEEGRARFPGKVLQPFFETMATELCDHAVSFIMNSRDNI